jgi:4-hydroxy-tetrahydrodipicolinate synthase
VRAAVDVPLVAGSGTNDTRHAVELTGRASDAGVDGVLVVTPYYNRPSQAGIEAHFRAVAAATDLPVLLYDIPVRAGRKIATEVMWRLAEEVPNIVGVKDAAAMPTESARLVAGAPAGFELYSGDDVFTLPLLAVGAVGVISVAAHWASREIGEMIAAFTKGDVDLARELNARLIPSWDIQSGDAHPNPLPTKALLRALGLPAGQCRLPMGDAPAGLENEILEVWRALGNQEP